MKKDKKEDKGRMLKILKSYARLVKEGYYFPTRAELKDLGISRDMVRHHFGNMSKLRKAAKESYPEIFSGSIDISDYLSRGYVRKITQEIKKYNRFVVTTAVSGQKADDEFIASIKKYCKLNKAKLLILPAHDPAHNLDNEIDWHFDPSLVNETIVFDDIFLNSNFFINGIRVTAKQINPITGLSEISQKRGSFILGSPKQMLEYDSVSANKLPHARMTSGACTIPNYKSTKGNSLRTAYLASEHHKIGAVIVEIVDENIYHFRQIQAGEDGSFCDLGFKYSKKGKKREIPVVVAGDYHSGEHDETAVKALMELINYTRADEIVFHDMFNGASINHHEEEDIMLRAERAKKGLNILENELVIASKEFDRILSLKSIKRGVVVKSNHDDFIDRWLRKGKFAKDPMNFILGCKLATEVQGTNKDFFKTGLELTRLPDHFDKLKWLRVDEDYVVGGIHLGAHGDKAANGSRGSIKSLSKSYPKGVIGHSHTPGIFKNMFQVGTTSLLRLGYNKGPSSWVHCSCLVYRNGQRQLINFINGYWHL